MNMNILLYLLKGLNNQPFLSLKYEGTSQKLLKQNYCSPLPSAALLSLGLTNVTGSPLILTRSQKRAHPSSSALRIIIGADDGVVQDRYLTTIPFSELNQLIQQATSTVLVPVVEWRKMSQAQRGHGLLTSGVRAKATMIATMTEVTTLCRLPTMMDRNPA